MTDSPCTIVTRQARDIEQLLADVWATIGAAERHVARCPNVDCGADRFLAGAYRRIAALQERQRREAAYRQALGEIRENPYSIARLTGGGKEGS